MTQKVVDCQSMNRSGDSVGVDGARTCRLPRQIQYSSFNLDTGGTIILEVFLNIFFNLCLFQLVNVSLI